MLFFDDASVFIYFSQCIFLVYGSDPLVFGRFVSVNLCHQPNYAQCMSSEYIYLLNFYFIHKYVILTFCFLGHVYLLCSVKLMQFPYEILILLHVDILSCKCLWGGVVEDSPLANTYFHFVFWKFEIVLDSQGKKRGKF
jgi:hypothetical protein